MGKRKKIAIVVAVCCVIVAGAGGYFYNKNKDVQPANTTVDTPKVQTKEEIQQSLDGKNAYNAVLTAFSTKDYTKTAALAKQYGADANNSAINKLNMYGLCMLSAKELKNDKLKTECYELSKNAANTLPEADKKTWLATIEDTYNGTQNNKGTDDGSPS